jgi:ATP-dependent Lon protease
LHLPQKGDDAASLDVAVAREILNLEHTFTQKYKRRIAELKVILTAAERRAAMSRRQCGFCSELHSQE